MKGGEKDVGEKGVGSEADAPLFSSLTTQSGFGKSKPLLQLGDLCVRTPMQGCVKP